METTMLILRLGLAAVFLAASIGKALDPAGSRQALVAFGLPERVAPILAPTVVALECLSAIGMIVPATAIAGTALAAVLLLAFTVGTARLVRAGEAPECHCFGQFHSEPVGAATVARNAAMLALAVALLVAGPGKRVDAVDGTELALMLTSLAAAGLAVLSYSLWTENRLLRGPSGPALDPDAGLPVGTPAPAVEVETLDGGRVDLAAAFAGRRSLLVQVNPHCEPCRLLMTELPRWQETLSEHLNLVLVSAGGADMNREFAADHQAERLLVAQGMEVAEAYEVRSTPSAVLIGESGEIAESPATGTLAIEALVRRAAGDAAAAAGAAASLAG